jgi:hypothetical protein
MGLHRAVTPEPDLGSQRGKQRTAPSVSSTLPWRWLPPNSGLLPVHVAGPSQLIAPPFRTAGSRTKHSRTSWRSNKSGSFKLGPKGTGRISSLLRHCRRLHCFLLRPSTAGVRLQAFRALRLAGERGFRFRLRAPSVPEASPFPTALKNGATRGCTFAPPPAAPRNAQERPGPPGRTRHARPCQGFRQPRPTPSRET